MLSSLPSRTAATPRSAVEGLYATGYWLYTTHRVHHARAVFRALLHLAPRDERGWMALGACYEAQGRNDLALRLYDAGRRALARAPRCEVGRARILRGQGRVQAAREALARAALAAEGSTDRDLRALIASEWARTQPTVLQEGC